MKLKPTFSVRLTLWYSLMLFLAMSIFGFLSYLFISKQLYDEQFSGLSEDAEQISEVIHLKNDSLDTKRLIEETDEFNLNENGVFFEVWDSEPKSIFRSRNFPRNLQTFHPANNKSKRTKISDRSGSKFNLYTSPIFVTGRQDEKKIITISVGQSILYVEKILHRIRNLLFFLIPVVLILTGYGGWYLARRALNPVAEITRTAKELSTQHLELQMPESSANDELGELVRTFNDMIKRIKTGVGKIRQFTADASHELRTPLTIMHGEMEVALRKTRSKEEYCGILRSTLQELSFMEKIINDLLLLSRADSGEMVFQRKKITMNKFFTEISSQFQNFSGEHNISFDVQNSKQEAICFIDPDKIKQVILNIIDNAVKYTPAGGKIRLTLKQQRNEVLLICADTGIGINKEDLPFVFDRFYRADKSRSREQHSSGLGLSICKWIVEAHDGDIKIESKINQGTKVTVRLPEESE